MKKSIHPDYRPVVFRDRAANYAFLTRSTATSERTIEWEDGNSYPVVDVEVSSASHPFYRASGAVPPPVRQQGQGRLIPGTRPTPSRWPASCAASGT